MPLFYINITFMFMYKRVLSQYAIHINTESTAQKIYSFYIYSHVLILFECIYFTYINSLHCTYVLADECYHLYFIA